MHRTHNMNIKYFIFISEPLLVDKFEMCIVYDKTNKTDLAFLSWKVSITIYLCQQQK